MRLKFQLESSGVGVDVGSYWYHLVENPTVYICRNGLVQCGLLAREDYPREISLSLVLNKPKRGGYERVDMIDTCGLYDIKWGDLRQYWQTLLPDASYWVGKNIALGRQQFSIWVKLIGQSNET